MLAELLQIVRPRAPWSLQLTGNSMHPTIRHGDDLLVHPAQSAPRLGDVIVFAQQDILVAHRVIGHGAGVFITAGDASSGVRELVTQNSIAGVVKCVRRNGRVVHARLSSPLAGAILRVRLALKYHLRLRR